MKKVLKIGFIDIFLRQKNPKQNPPDPSCVLHAPLTDFPKCLKNVIFPKFLVNTLKLCVEVHKHACKP